ncbi:hypothetical protein Tco_1001666 [Tanacetum coccineum]
MDDEPMLDADRVVAPTPDSAIIIPETATEFAIKGSSNYDTDKIMARMDAMTMKIDAQYKEFEFSSKPNPDHKNDDKPIFLVDFVFLEMEEESKVPLILGRPFLPTADAVIRVKPKQLNLGVGTERMTFHRDSAIKHYYFNDDTCFIIDDIDEILKEYLNALLNEDKPPMDLELKPLPDNLEYPFLEEPSFLPVIISSQLSEENKNKLISILKRHKQAFAWKTTDIPGICPSSKHKIQLLEDKKPVVRKQRRLNPNIQEVSLIHRVPKKGGITVVTNEKDELVLTRTVTGLEVDKANIDVSLNFHPATNVKGIRSFLGHAGFYRRFIKDFSKIAHPLTKLLEKDTPFEFNEECHKAFNS